MTNYFQNELNNDLQKINDWGVQWKMFFLTPILTNRHKKCIFQRKIQIDDSQILTFNGCNIGSSFWGLRHLGPALDEKVNFDGHIQSKITKCSILIGIIKRLSTTFPCDVLSTICKSFIRSYLDYADSFSRKIKHVRYRACLIMTGSIQGAAQEKLYQELGLESLSDRRWYGKLVFCYKINNNLSPTYPTA